MADVNPVLYDSSQPATAKTAQGVVIVEWTPLTTANVKGVAVYLPDYPDKTVHITGTFGAAPPTVVLEGSCRPGTTIPKAIPADADFSTLTDPSSTAISKTAQAIEAVLENTAWIRPRIASGGDGDTAVKVTLVCTKTARR